MSVWLNWKIRHGLASRGRIAPLKPRGIIARVLFALYYYWKEPRRLAAAEVERKSRRRVYKAHLEGKLTSTGKVGK